MEVAETKPGSYKEAGEEEREKIDDALSKGYLVLRPVLPQEGMWWTRLWHRPSK